MITNKRLFISSDFIHLVAIFKSNQGPFYEVFGSFKNATSDKVFSYSIAENKFTLSHFDQSITLFLLHQNLNQLDIEIGENDYLIYHDSPYIEYRTKASIYDKFQHSHRMACHHKKFVSSNPIEDQAYAIALEVILDSTVSPDKKAETIIERIWPQNTVSHSDRLKWLQIYFDRVPKQDEDCPEVFAVTPEIKQCFEEMKNYQRGTMEWETAYRTLNDESYKYLQNL